jgi:autotransporter-associated beta strand protein
MTTIWQGTNGDYVNGGNWSSGEPISGDTASFGASGVTHISLVTDTMHSIVELVEVGDWFFIPGASKYNFEIGLDIAFRFDAGGIEINGGSAHLFNFGAIDFLNSSSSGAASITNFNFLSFFQSSTAGSSIIDTAGGASTGFFNTSNGGSAQFITDAGGLVDFFFATGPAGNHQLTAGSIAGAGTYLLGANQLTVGLDGLSGDVSGLITDGGLGGSLVKVGKGTLKLSGANNTYSGGTTLEARTLELAAVEAAGTGAITFALGSHAHLFDRADLCSDLSEL